MLIYCSLGFEVVASYMKNWNELELGENEYCSNDRDFEDAGLIANKLKINLHQINFSKDYWLEIFR